VSSSLKFNFLLSKIEWASQSGCSVVKLQYRLLGLNTDMTQGCHEMYVQLIMKY